MENNKEDKSVTVEYGNENLRKILSDYLIQKFEDIIKAEQK